MCHWLGPKHKVSFRGNKAFLSIASLAGGAAYKVHWENTTQRQFTFIMRDNPWLLIIPGGAVIFVSGLLLPRIYWARGGYVYLSFGIGFLAGHVFW